MAVIPAITCAMVIALLATVASSAAPVFDDPLLKDRQAVDDGMARAGYACAVVTAPATVADRELRIFVTTATAKARAEAVRRELDSPDLATVLMTEPREASERLERIRRRAVRTAPDDAQGVGIGGNRLYRRSCPKVELMILPRPKASPASERWAKQLRSRYGPDRVRVTRGRSTPK